MARGGSTGCNMAHEVKRMLKTRLDKFEEEDLEGFIYAKSGRASSMDASCRRLGWVGKGEMKIRSGYLGMAGSLTPITLSRDPIILTLVLNQTSSSCYLLRYIVALTILSFVACIPRPPRAARPLVVPSPPTVVSCFTFTLLILFPAVYAPLFARLDQSRNSITLALYGIVLGSFAQRKRMDDVKAHVLFLAGVLYTVADAHC
jgi:hypothetical protein